MVQVISFLIYHYSKISYQTAISNYPIITWSEVVVYYLKVSFSTKTYHIELIYIEDHIFLSKIEEDHVTIWSIFNIS